MTKKEKQHRARLKPFVDRLVRADEWTRGALVTQIREIAVPELLLLLGEILADRARRTSRPEVATGAMSGLVQLGAAGALSTCALALNGPQVVRAAATEALKRHGPGLPLGEWAELRGALLRTRAQAADPQVLATCDDILAALRAAGPGYENHIGEGSSGRDGGGELPPPYRPPIDRAVPSTGGVDNVASHDERAGPREGWEPELQRSK